MLGVSEGVFEIPLGVEGVEGVEGVPSGVVSVPEGVDRVLGVTNGAGVPGVVDGVLGVSDGVYAISPGVEAVEGVESVGVSRWIENSGVVDGVPSAFEGV